MMNYKRPYKKHKNKKYNGSAQQHKAQIIFMFWLGCSMFHIHVHHMSTFGTQYALT